MIDQSHRFRFTQSRPMTPRDEGNSQRVETGSNASAVEEIIDPPVLVAAEYARHLRARALYRQQQLPKFIWNRYGKGFSWIALLSLGITYAHCATLEIDGANLDRGLGKSASGVKRYLEHCSHPRRLVFHCSPQLLNLSISEFGFYLRRRSADTQTLQWICLSKFSPYRFTNQLGKEFEFQQRCVVGCALAVNGVALAPFDVRRAVLVSHLTRVHDVMLRQEGTNGLPCCRVAPLRISAWLLPVGSQITRHPSEKRGTCAWGTDTTFVSGSFVRSALGLARLARIIDAQSSRCFSPVARVKISPLQIPERRSLVPTQKSHRHRVVSQTPTGFKWKRVVFSGLSWVAVGSQTGEIPTVTPRGIAFPSCLAFSLTRGSYFGSQLKSNRHAGYGKRSA